jgi:hypothetical protein
MMHNTGGRRFFAGAVAGLLLALLVIGASSLLPRQGAPQFALSQNAAASSTATMVADTSQNTSGGAQNQLVISSSTSQAIAPSANATISTPSNSSSVEYGSAVTAATAIGGIPPEAPRPDSALSAISSESVGNILSIVAPLLVGLLLAGLVYSTYVRRLDSTS